MGVVVFVIFGLITWRAYRQTSRRADELSAYAVENAAQLERIAAQLNQHGFQLEHTLNEIAPKLQVVSQFLDNPLIGAALPWVLRRLMRRPYRRR